jgi:transposase
MPQRRPLGEIDANHRIRKELTPTQRAQIVGAAKCGQTITQIAKTFGIPIPTVQSTIERDPQRQDYQSRPGRGRPSKTTVREVTSIVNYVRANPKHTYTQIRQNVAPLISNRTISRILKCGGIRKWICKRRPFLNEQVVQKRLEWVTARKDWSEEEWATIIFSDKSSIERG